MITRRDSLDQALDEIQAHELSGATTIVLSRRMWAGLSTKEQDAYRARADRAGVELRADDALTGHYVEVRGREDGPSLSTEQPV